MDPLSIMHELEKRKFIPPIYPKIEHCSTIFKLIQEFSLASLTLEANGFDGDVVQYKKHLGNGQPERAYRALNLKEYRIDYRGDGGRHTLHVTDDGTITSTGEYLPKEPIHPCMKETNLLPQITAFYAQMLNLKAEHLNFFDEGPQVMRSTSVRMGWGKERMFGTPPDAKYTLKEVTQKIGKKPKIARIMDSPYGDGFQYNVIWEFNGEPLRCVMSVRPKLVADFYMDISLPELLKKFSTQKRHAYVEFYGKNTYAYLEQGDSRKLLPINTTQTTSLRDLLLDYGIDLDKPVVEPEKIKMTGKNYTLFSNLADMVRANSIPEVRFRTEKRKNVALVATYGEKQLVLTGRRKFNGDYAEFLSNWFTGNYAKAEAALKWQIPVIAIEHTTNPDWHITFAPDLKVGTDVADEEAALFKGIDKVSLPGAIIDYLLDRPLLESPYGRSSGVVIGEGVFSAGISESAVIPVNRLFEYISEGADNTTFEQISSGTPSFNISWDFGEKKINARCSIYTKRRTWWNYEEFIDNFSSAGREGSILFDIPHLQYTQHYEQDQNGLLHFISEEVGCDTRYTKPTPDPMHYLLNKIAETEYNYVEPSKLVSNEELGSLMEKLRDTHTYWGEGQVFENSVHHYKWDGGRLCLLFKPPESLGLEHSSTSTTLSITKYNAEEYDYMVHLKGERGRWRIQSAQHWGGRKLLKSYTKFNCQQPYDYLNELFFGPQEQRFLPVKKTKQKISKIKIEKPKKKPKRTPKVQLNCTQLLSSITIREQTTKQCKHKTEGSLRF